MEGSVGHPDLPQIPPEASWGNGDNIRNKDADFACGCGRLFKGAKLDEVSKADKRTTFADIAGIDEVKYEMRELVAFLQNPKRFLDLGAKSPAGVLLVGNPGTGTPLPPPTRPTRHTYMAPLCLGFSMLSTERENTQRVCKRFHPSSPPRAGGDIGKVLNLVNHHSAPMKRFTAVRTLWLV